MVSPRGMDAKIMKLVPCIITKVDSKSAVLVKVINVTTGRSLRNKQSSDNCNTSGTKLIVEAQSTTDLFGPNNERVFFFNSRLEKKKAEKHNNNLRTGGRGIGDGGHIQNQGIALFLGVCNFEYPVIVAWAVPPLLHPI